MAYYGLVTRLREVHKDPNSDRLYLARVFGEGVIVGDNMREGELVLYLPSDGEIERWFGNELKLYRKNEDGTPQGGYIENNGHIRAIKLRGNESSGVVISYSRIVELFGEQGWSEDDRVTEINGKTFCCKYIPKRRYNNPRSAAAGTKSKHRKVARITYPQFDEHIDTEQLAYNLHKFQPGDKINITLKMHGTSQRSMRTYAELPRGFFRRLFRMKAKTKPVYVLGTRRTTIENTDGGYYGNNEFRLQHHKALEPYVEDGMEIFSEIVGYYGPNESDTIMPIVDNSKINDKAFQKKFGKRTIFSYGCQPGESAMWIYRITSNNGEKEWTPEEITEWCAKNGFNRVPVVDDFEFTTVEDLQARIDEYFKELVDPVGLTHLKEGVVVRIVNRPRFTAMKHKVWEFKVLSGIAVESVNTDNMSEDMIAEM